MIKGARKRLAGQIAGSDENKRNNFFSSSKKVCPFICGNYHCNNTLSHSSLPRRVFIFSWRNKENKCVQFSKLSMVGAC